MDTTLAINIPIAVYAYDRHKLATDPKAVKRIGFYDKRKVLTETKFQKYYVKAKAIASRMAFKMEQDKINKRIGFENEAIKEKNKEIVESNKTALTRFTTKAIIPLKEPLTVTSGADPEDLYKEAYRKNKYKVKQNENTYYNLYIPVKYYKINHTQVSGNIQGALAYQWQGGKRKWNIYNGSIPKNIESFYIEEIILEKWKDLFKIAYNDQNNNGQVDENEINKNSLNAAINSAKDANASLFQCKGFSSNNTSMDNLSLALGHVVTLSTISWICTVTGVGTTAIDMANALNTVFTVVLKGSLSTFRNTEEKVDMTVQPNAFINYYLEPSGAVNDNNPLGILFYDVSNAIQFIYNKVSNTQSRISKDLIQKMIDQGQGTQNALRTMIDTVTETQQTVGKSFADTQVEIFKIGNPVKTVSDMVNNAMQLFQQNMDWIMDNIREFFFTIKNYFYLIKRLKSLESNHRLNWMIKRKKNSLITSTKITKQITRLTNEIILGHQRRIFS